MVELLENTKCLAHSTNAGVWSDGISLSGQKVSFKIVWVVCL